MSLTWIENNKGKFGIIVILLLILFIALPILSHLDIWKFKTIYTVAKETTNFLYLISGFVLVLGLYLTINQIGILKTQVKDQMEGTEKQLEYIKEDMRTRNERSAVEKSMDYLNLFANEIIPKIEAYLESRSDRKTIRIRGWKPSDTDYKLDLTRLNGDGVSEIIEELQQRKNEGLLSILNKLESFSAGIIHGLGKEDVVYAPISNEFLEFISMEIVEISSQRHMGVPYENAIKLYRIWNSRKDLAQVALQIEQLESTLEFKRTKLLVAGTEAQPLKHIGE